MAISISRRKGEFQKLAIGTAGLLVVFACWSRLAENYHPLILPSPHETGKALLALWKEGSLVSNVLVTLSRTLCGCSLALFSGFALAVLTKGTTFWQALVRPILTLIQIIPPVVWTVLAVIWFGIADHVAPVFLIFVVTLPVAFVSYFSGLDSIDGQLVEMAAVYRCSRLKTITEIYLPALIPHFVSTVSVGISFAWKAAIFAEFMGSTTGVGFALSTANSNLQTEKVFAWVLVLIAVMLVCEYGLLTPLRRRAARWSA